MAEDIDTEALKDLVAQEKWSELLSLTEVSPRESSPSAGKRFFRGLALLRLGKARDALQCIRSGLMQSPASEWGNQLAFDASLAAGEATTAFEDFRTFIAGSVGREPQKAWYVQKAAELGLFQIAAEMNETRTVISDSRRRPMYALALQCFSKVDTLTKTFARLASLHNSKDYAIVLIIDSCKGSGLHQNHVQGNAEVRNLVAAEVPRLLNVFFSVEIMQNERNLGTAPTCRRLLDHVAHNYAGFLFIEDDCLLAPSALDWTSHHLRETVGTLGPWFLSCESIFFDKQTRELNSMQRQQLLAFASQPWLCATYHMLDFVPSTCFGTTSDIWKLCANVRSFTRGPESLSRLMASMGKKTVSSVVPRASDIGMMHDLGYSVTLMGRDHVRETKDTFLMAEGRFDRENSAPFVGDPDLLYSATSLLRTEHLEKFKAPLSSAKDAT